jgi:hypothetical protein
MDLDSPPGSSLAPRVRAGEPPLLAFVSSVMVGELQAARDRVVDVLDDVPFLLGWAFERTPASSQDLDWSYLEKVRRAAFVFWLVGDSTTEPVEREVDEAISAGRRLIVMLLPVGGRDEQTVRLVERVRPHAKYREPADLDELAVEVNLAVSDEINRALQDLPGMARAARLDELGRASRSRCVERWQAAGVDLAPALDVANDVGIGRAPDGALPAEDRPLVVFCGDVGVGKSLAAERYHQAAIAAQFAEASCPVPVYVRARDVGGDLTGACLRACEGLGDPRLQGAVVVVDGADEPGVGVAGDLLRQARELSRTWPSTRIVMTSRPVSSLTDAQEAVSLPRLSAEEARELVARFADFEITTGFAGGWPANLREAIELPLFAVLLGASLRRSGGRMPGSRAELLRGLVEGAIGRVERDARPPLRRLAVLSLRRGGGPVPEADVAPLHELADLEQTRLLVARERTLVFPLIVIAQWFAAESLVAGEPAIEELIADPAHLEDWRYPLAIVAGAYGHEDVSALLGPLAQVHPGFASQVIEEGIAKWSDAEEVLPPDARECGERVRASMAHWIAGLGPLASAIAPVDRDGHLLPIGVGVSDHWLTTGWYVGAEQRDAVTTLPQDLFGFLLNSGPASREWAALRGARPGHQAAWAWRWSFEQLRAALAAVLNRRSLRLPDSPLQDSRLWTVATALGGDSPLHDEPIAIEPLLQGVPPDADIVLTPRGQIATTGLVQALQTRLARGETHLHPPFPGPDQSLGDGWLWEPWSEQRILERTRTVFEVALRGYQHLASTLFSPLAPWMQTAVTLPARLNGRLHPPLPGAGLAGGPTLTWWLQALEPDKDIEIAITIDPVRDRHPWDEVDGHDLVMQARALRPQQARWLDTTLHDGFLDIFEPCAAEELLYKWLWSDLKRIRWTDGTLRGRPTGHHL